MVRHKCYVNPNPGDPINQYLDCLGTDLQIYFNQQLFSVVLKLLFSDKQNGGQQIVL